MPNEQSPAVLAYAKAYTHADRLFDALVTLEEVGGIGQAAADAKWTPKALRKALASLDATREAINRQLAGFELHEPAAVEPTPTPRPTRPLVQRPSLDQSPRVPDQAEPTRGPLSRRTAARTRVG